MTTNTKDKAKSLCYLNDLVIKKAFAKETKASKEFIARVIHGATNLPLEDLMNLEQIHPEIAFNANTVNSVADLVLKNDTRYFSIEFNYSRSPNSERKNLLYTFQLSLRQVKNVSDYSKMLGITQINIDAYDLYGQGEYIYKFILEEEKYHIPCKVDLVTIYHINLSFYKGIDYTSLIERESSLLRDLLILVCRDKELLDKVYKGDKTMEKMRKEFEGLVQEVDGILYYDEEAFKRLCSYDDGKMDGVEQGIEQGMKQRTIEIAKNMLKDKLSIEAISKYTDLSLEEIALLQNELE